MNKPLSIRLAACPTQPVPKRYRGVWRRTLLETPEVRDTTTTVFWLQTSRWHADIRIPGGRPDFAGVGSLHECTEQQVQWLASQQGFAGITEVAVNADSETCSWHRLLDFQPPAAVPDAGHMDFQADKLVETGVHASYLEDWVKLPDSDQGFAVLERTQEKDADLPAELLLVAGEFVMHVRDRRAAWPNDGGQGAALRDLVDAGHASLLDMEISFGRRSPEGWTIQHSLQPWLENRAVPIQICGRDDAGICLLSHGIQSAWRVHEWTAPPLP